MPPSCGCGAGPTLFPLVPTTMTSPQPPQFLTTPSQLCLSRKGNTLNHFQLQHSTWYSLSEEFDRHACDVWYCTLIVAEQGFNCQGLLVCVFEKTIKLPGNIIFIHQKDMDNAFLLMYNASPYILIFYILKQCPFSATILICVLTLVSADAGFLYDTYCVQLQSNIESIVYYTLISLVMYSLTIITVCKSTTNNFLL